MKSSTSTLEQLLQHRLILVAGKGGTGRSTMAAALALAAARQGKEVLAIDACGTGNLAAALGGRSTEFNPVRVRHRISVICLRPEAAMSQYLHEFFHVPKLARLTPMSRIFDFIATTLPGPRDMLVMGKIVYEARIRDNNAYRWDLVVADCQPTGQFLKQLGAPQAMRRLFRGGMIAAHVKLVEEMLNNQAKTTVALCSLPEEMPVSETLELCTELQKLGSAQASVCYLNRMYPLLSTAATEKRLRHLPDMPSPAASPRLRENLPSLQRAVDTAAELHKSQAAWATSLKQQLPLPVIEIPVQLANPGLATARGISEKLG